MFDIKHIIVMVITGVITFLLTPNKQNNMNSAILFSIVMGFLIGSGIYYGYQSTAIKK